MATFQPTARTVFFIEPHPHRVKPGVVDITTIATRVYGKPFRALDACRADDDRIGNDTHKLYELSSDEDYEQALFDGDGTEIYLGLDRAGESHYHRGHNSIEYWLSVGWPGLGDLTEADVTVEANPDDWADLYGSVFPESVYAQRRTSPGLSIVLADLIRRGELPRGDYLFKHWW